MTLPADDRIERACDVPLIEQLRSVPKHLRHIHDESPTSSRSIPFGRMCHDAADALEAIIPKAAEPEFGKAGFVDHGGVVYWYNPENLPPPNGPELYWERERAI